ncbi:MAG: single-stranded-DNA-specific exonuclease RecJ [Akkermansiaceae bacterium]|nr:single-stranded-DNA-specific exonuclease RecJ [Akkermansiaceae bacterium]
MRTKFDWETRPIGGAVDFGAELNGQLPPLVRRLLAQRGIRGREAALGYLRPRLADLADPFLLAEMDAAVERIFRAVDGGEEICIYGDYDVDGVSSVSLLMAVLEAYGAHPRFFIPIRTKEGYGLSRAGMERCGREGPRPGLMVTVDCGTSSVDEVAALRERGIDVIVLDHHEAGAGGRPPAAAVVNAKLEKDSPFTYLCSAGVVFKLAHALLKTRRLDGFDLRDYLDIVAVATVADIVPLVGENRLLTRHGLRMMGEGRGNPGLRALNEITNAPSVLCSSHVSFRLGPRLNAAGRMDAPLDAVELLRAADMRRAREFARRLDEHNRRRQAREEAVRAEAVEMLDRDFSPDADPVIVLGSRAWHPGIVGIVASYLMRVYHKPTFVISIDAAGVGKGSGRSVEGVSLVRALHYCRSAGLAISGGGHEMAAGVMLDEGSIDAFRRVFGEYVASVRAGDARPPVLAIDAEVGFPELTLELLDSYELLEPFGNGNPQPVFMSRGVNLSDAPRRLQGNHLKFSLRQGLAECDAIYFNGADMPLPEPPWDVAFTIDRSVWRGRSSLSMSIQDIRPACA